MGPIGKRDVGPMPPERGVVVNHPTIFRRFQDAVADRWTCLDQAADKGGERSPSRLRANVARWP
jgi:hypothetical protein